MTKQERIQEGYQKHYVFFKYFIDEDGWLDKLKIGIENTMLIIQLTNEIPCESKMNDSHKIRPKSLQGIENNNGWIKIENKDDLPKIEVEYWVKKKNTIPIVIRQFVISHTDSWLKCYTHYQPITKPELPLH